MKQAIALMLAIVLMAGFAMANDEKIPLLIGLMLVLPASFMVLAVAFGQALEPWMANGFSIVWGVFFYLLSLTITSRILKRRMPEVVNWVQTV